MFTSFDKALVALVMAVAFMAQNYLGWDLGFLTAEFVQTALGVLTPIFVWAVPNKPSPA